MFDGIARKGSPDNWISVETGQDIINDLKKLTKSADDCCIDKYTIAGHGWRFKPGGGRDLYPGIPGGRDDFGFYESSTGRKKEVADLADLKKAIDSGDIKFCDPCSIQIYACRIDPSFTAKLSTITGCSVVAASGSCAPAKGGMWKCGPKNDKEKTESGYFGFYRCLSEGDLRHEGPYYQPF